LSRYFNSNCTNKLCFAYWGECSVALIKWYNHNDKCDTRLHDLSEAKAFRQVSMPVPNPSLRNFQRWGGKRGVMSKGASNHKEATGLGENRTGEHKWISDEAALCEVIESGCDDDDGNIGKSRLSNGFKDTHPRSIGDTLPDCISLVQNVETPMRSQGRSIPWVSYPQGKPNSLVGVGRIKKRRLPAERQQESITGQIGPGNRRYPRWKAADVILVHHPKNDVKAIYQGKS